MSEFLERIRNLPPKRLALLALELQTQLEELQASVANSRQAEPIAVIGMACRFPGGANTPEAFWQRLSSGTDCIIPVPAARWDADALYDLGVDANGKMTTRWGGFLDDIDQFDPEFFGISPREANRMDPQQRIALELCWQALERAGYAPDGLVGSPTGVFFGLCNADYYQLQLNASHVEPLDMYSVTGCAPSIAAGRISYLLGLQGPSLSVDTACSSSLVAIHLAMQSLRSGESQLALAGGVNLILTPDATIAFSRAGMMARDGRCKAFEAAGDGYARSEGGAFIVLKRLSAAVADGNPILAVLRGSAVNQDGRSNGLTAPNGPSQQAVMQSALANANVTPDQISYVETHGTGTPLGDPIEVQALGAVFGPTRPAPLMLGSVKTNIGHTEAAAGIAGVCKTILSLEHKQIPPHLHLQQPNPFIPWDELPITVPTQLTAWDSPNPRRAAVSSFGFSGTNAVLVVEQAPLPEPRTEHRARPLHLVTLSARTEKALHELASRYQEHLTAVPELALVDVAFTSNVARAHFEHRVAVLASNTKEAADALSRLAAGQTAPKVMVGSSQGARHASIAFLFTGQGAQYVGMGRQLFESEPVFRQAILECDELTRPYLGESLLPLLYPPTHDDQADAKLADILYAQPAVFAIEYALTKLWAAWGIRPDAVLGHSIGEYAAACIAGVLTVAEAVQLLCERTRLMKTMTAEGEMATVFASAERVRELLAPFAGRASLAAINTPDSVVISGEHAAMEQVLGALKNARVHVQRLPISIGAHSPLMDPILDAFELTAAEISFQPPTVEYISGMTGKIASADELATPRYWRRQLREPVQFADGIATLHEQGYRLVVEVGPSPTLIGMAQRTIQDNATTWIPSLRPGHDDWKQLLNGLGTLYVNGVPVDWDGYSKDGGGRRVLLPTYPFQRQRYWLKQTLYRHVLPLADSGAPENAASQDASAERVQATELGELFHAVVWREQPRTLNSMTPLARGTWVVFADGTGVGEQVVAALRARGESCVVVRQGVRGSKEAKEDFYLDPTSRDEFNRLFQSLTGTKQPPLQGILYLWALDSQLAETDTAQDLERSLAVAGEGLLHLLQSVETNRGVRPPKLWLVTRGAQPVDPADEIAPTQATLWGLRPVIAIEQPELHSVCIDLDSRADDSDVAALLAEISAGDSVEDQIAFRQGKRFVRRLVRAAEHVETADVLPPEFKSDATYLLTGGLGGIGLLVAQRMVERGARHLVLMGRHAPPPSALEPLKAMEGLGAEIVVLPGDVTQRESLASALAQIHRAMPPLRGILHIAATLDGGVLLQQNWDRFRTVLAPKALGAWNLHTLTRAMDLDWLVFFSSGAALVGLVGEGSYAAANAFLDSFAYYRRSQNLKALAVNWGAWVGVGQAARFDVAKRREIQGMSAAQGLAALESAMGQTANGLPLFTQVVIMPVTDESYPQRSLGQVPPFLCEVLVTQPEHKLTEDGYLARQLAAASPDRRTQILIEYLSTEAGQILGLDHPVDVNASLTRVGMDSLMAVQLRNRTEGAMATSAPASIFLQGLSVREMAEPLLELLPPSGAAQRFADASTPTPLPAAPLESDLRKLAQEAPEKLLSNLDGLSDEQVNLLLGDLLAQEEPRA